MADGKCQDILDQPWEFDEQKAVANAKSLAGMMQRVEARCAALESLAVGLQAQVNTLLAVPGRISAIVTRPFDLDFVVDELRDAEVRYTLLLPVKLLAIGTDSAAVSLLLDGEEVARAGHTMKLGVGLSLNDERDPIHILAAHVPAGSTVRLSILDSSANAAAPSFIVGQETLL